MARCGGSLEDLDQSGRRDALVRWRQIFAINVQAHTGESCYGGMDFHVFSWRFSPSDRKTEAIRSYQAENPKVFFVLPEDEELPAFCCSGGRLPDFSGFWIDVLIFPSDLSWTMVFTHDDEQPQGGPYFSRREWQQVTADPPPGLV